MQKPIYLDYNSTTPTDPRVTEAMLPYFSENYGNPSNTLHSYGWSAENAVKHAAESVARLLHCKSNEVIWNAGATEGNNSVIFGLIRKIKLTEGPLAKIHMITTNAEHWSVLNAMAAAEVYEGISVTQLPVNAKGRISTQDLQKHLRPETRLVSVIWANNEIGTINPISELAQLCQEKEIYFHTDATQAIGKVEVDLAKSQVHFLTFSAHKLYGPKGLGVLFTRSQNPHIEIEPLILGGGQQNNRRSGTLNVPSIVGTGRAAELILQEAPQEAARLRTLSANFFQKIKTKIPSVVLNGFNFDEKDELQNWLRSPMNISVQFPLAIDLVINKLSGLAFSQGSACQSGETTSSHVLSALGLNFDQTQRTIRFSIGRWTTSEQLDQAVTVLESVFAAKKA